MGFHPGGFPALSGMSVNTICFNSYACYTTVFRRAREGTRPIEVSAVREAQSLSLTFS